METIVNKRRRGPGFWIILIVLAVGTLIMILPLFWMVTSSFKSQSELFSMPTVIFPEVWKIENYERVFDQMPFARYYLNSIWTAAVNTGVGVLTSAIIAYVFAKYHFKWRNAIFVGVLAFMMIPYDTLMIPLYKIMTGLQWTDSYIVLTIPYFVNITGIFLMRQSFMDLPDDYLEAGEIDGCSQIRTFFTIALPMVRPTVAALAIFLFMASYNSYMWPLISVDSRDLFTLPVGLAALTYDRNNQMDLMMASSTMVVIPLMIVFAVGQKQFIEGISLGGLKG
jgi:ABC-type glycerol-3-phosphate transport system permease component